MPTWNKQGTKQTYDAIVIGSGIGGSIAAALLAKQGFQVLVLEKNITPGGIMASYERDGYKIDVGSHLIPSGAKGPLGQVLKNLGLTKPLFLTHNTPSTSKGMFESRLPKHRYQLLNYAFQTIKAMKIPARDVVRLANMMRKILTMSHRQMQKWDRRSLDEFIVQHTEFPPAYFLLSFLMSIFFVLPPWYASAGESLMTLKKFMLDYSLSYIKGGMDSYINALLEYVEDRDGEIAVDSQVTEITPTSKGFTVATKEDEYHSDYVVCNMFPGDLLRILSTENTEALNNYANRVSEVKPSYNAFQLKIGLKRKILDEGSFIGGVSLEGMELQDLTLDYFRQCTEKVEQGAIVDPLSIYAPIPTNFDPTLAPDGKQLIVASIYGPICENPVNSADQWRQKSLDMVASIIPNMYDELDFYEFTNIPEVGQWMGKSSNGAISNGQLPGQVGADRLPVTTPVSGLYVCGDGAGGRGIGTELCAVSAMEAVEALIGENRIRKG